MTDLPIRADLLIHGAALVATVDDDRRELAGGWVAITDGLISGVGGSADSVPDAERIIDAGGCLVTPGLVNTHHHLFQNLTRAYPPMTSAPLFGWLQSLYPLWTAAIDEEAEYLAAWVGLAELALSGCTTSSDHHYLHPVRAGDLLGAEIQAAVDLGMRFHPTYASMSVGGKRRRTPARRGRTRRRRHPRRVPTGGGTPSRPQPRRDGPGCARPLLAVLGERRPHDP